MINDSKRRYDGFLSLEGGIDSGNAPNEIKPNQAAFAVNTTFRGSQPATRPPYEGLLLSFDSDTTETRFNIGKYQGAGVYTSAGGQTVLIVAHGGMLFRISEIGDLNLVSEISIKFELATTNVFTVPAIGVTVAAMVNSITGLTVGDMLVLDSGSYTITVLAAGIVTLLYNGGAANATVAAGTVLVRSGEFLYDYDLNSDADMAFLFQAEQWMIVFQGEYRPIFFDGSNARRALDNEIPASYCGGYMNGRIWYALANRTQYEAGDIVGGDSGTSQNSFKDAILKVTENTFLNEGGSFNVPSSFGLITAVLSTAQLDTSLGQGPVAIFCEFGVITNQSPVDRTTWKDLTYPIQTQSLVDYGSLSPRSTIPVNGDIWYRSIDGVRSWIIARRNFNQGWGNTPMSFEMNRVLNNDTATLLEFGSAIVFDNRLLATCSPHRDARGVSHRGLAVINFDEVSTMGAKDNPAWEGLWTGINIHQVIKGRIDGTERAFAVVNGNQGRLEVWEILTQGENDEQTVRNDDASTQVNISRIQCFLETRSMSCGASGSNPFELKMLRYAEIFVRDVRGQVDFSVQLRPDQYPCWVNWHSWSECNKLDQCEEVCPNLKNFQPGYRPFMRTPEAPEDCLPNAARANLGYEFQLRIAWTGHAVIKQLRIHAEPRLDETVGECRT